MSKEYKNIGIVVAENEEKARELALEKFPNLKDGNFVLRQDEDCLDTWFSSWLWPISVFDGINKPDNEDIKYYYPTNDLVTGPDIIFFWVARMVTAGYEYRGEECFKNVYFTGIVRDKLGRKMSKQLGNSPDPIELMNKYGADGVRMGMLLSAAAGNDILFDDALCEQGRNFNNKIWNSLRLVKGWEVETGGVASLQNKVTMEWFSNLLEKNKAEVDDLFTKYRLSEALMTVYKLFWDEFSAWYLEIIKPEYGKPIDEPTYNATINFFEELLQQLHPFMPFITEELWHAIRERGDNESIMTSRLTEINRNVNEEIISQFEIVKEIITNIRNIRVSKNISPKETIQLYVSEGHNSAYDEIIKKLCNVEKIGIVEDKPASTISFMVGTDEYFIPIEINIEEEIAKMEKEIAYHEGFLRGVMAKLSNERFVANAKPEVVELERKKQSDAEQKIKSLKDGIGQLTMNNE